MPGHRSPSTITSEFDDLFRHADELGLNVDVIAVIVVAGLLGGPLGEYLSVGTQSAVASLQSHARQATEVIREMGRHGSALVRVTADSARCDVLRPDQAQAVEVTLQRVNGFRDLLDQLLECARMSAERLAEHRDEHAKARRRNHRVG